jgi:type IV secretion system protein VirB4
VLAKTKIIKKEMDDIGIYLPFLRHLNESMVMLENGHMMAVLKLDGISFETIDIADINALNNQLNVIWRNIASDQLSVMHHLVRREEKSYPDGDFTSAFASKLNGTYRQSIINTKLFVNDLYLTLVWRPRDALKQKASAFMAKIRKSKKRVLRLMKPKLKVLRKPFATSFPFCSIIILEFLDFMLVEVLPQKKEFYFPSPPNF